MKYFSMFSGIGGFDLALNRLEHQCVGYSEINEYSIKTYKKNFGNEVMNYGDATKIDTNRLPDFDLLCGGFPCQAFSIAGKRRGFEDTRGTMFFEIARILKDKRPSYILLENVKGLLNHNKGETYRVIIQALDELGYDTQWMVLNSKFFGVPQNRERVFIIGNIRGKSRPEILPFKEICGETKELVYAQKSDREIARVYSIEGVSPTLHLKTGGWQEPKISVRVQGDLDKRKTYLSSEIQTLAANPTSDNIPRILVANCLDANYNKGNSASKERHTNRTTIGTLTEAQGRQGSSSEFFSACETVSKFTNGIRRLTPLECERLQGFPDNWTQGVSDTRRYNQLGNAVTVNVIDALIKRMLPNLSVQEVVTNG